MDRPPMTKPSTNQLTKYRLLGLAGAAGGGAACTAGAETPSSSTSAMRISSPMPAVCCSLGGLVSSVLVCGMSCPGWPTDYLWMIKLEAGLVNEEQANGISLTIGDDMLAAG